jgi:uncharacterized protein YggE
MLRSALFASILIAGSTAMSAHAQTIPGYTVPADATLLSVAVQASATRVPDIATLSVGVVTEAPDGNAAMRANAAQMTKVVAAIRAAGVAERDVQTSGVHLSPQYQYRDQQAPRITGYQANNTVNVKIREIANLGEVMDALAGAGANQISGPNFQIDQPEPVYDEARRKAVELARSRAETYASALGLTVRRVVSLNEGGSAGPPMPMMRMAMAADSVESTPVAPGENTVSVHLEVVFELGR